MSTVPAPTPGQPDSADLTEVVTGLSTDTSEDRQHEQATIISLAEEAVRKELNNISVNFGVDLPVIAQWVNRKIREIMETGIATVTSFTKVTLQAEGYLEGKAPASAIRKIVETSTPKALDWVRRIVDENHN